MTRLPRANRTHVFVLRVWQEDLGDGRREWRGGIQDIASREMRYFRDWTMLIEFVRIWMQNLPADDSLELQQ